MKVGLIYTSTTPELIELVEREVKKQLGGGVELYSLQDPSILADVREAGYVTTAPAARLIAMYMQAAQAGCDAMLNLCSSVGEVADSVQDAAKYIGVPIVRVDEEMCREAVRKGADYLGVGAMFPTGTKADAERVPRQVLRNICAAVDVPVVASGGAGSVQDFVTLFQALPKVDAGLAASIFHFGQVSIPELKRALAAEGIPTRLPL